MYVTRFRSRDRQPLVHTVELHIVRHVFQRELHRSDELGFQRVSMIDVDLHRVEQIMYGRRMRCEPIWIQCSIYGWRIKLTATDSHSTERIQLACF